MRIHLSRPHMGGSELEHVRQAFESNYIAPVGPQLDQFEESVAGYVGGQVHCLAVSSGTAALHLALRLLDLTADDEVWVCSMTFAGGVFPVLYEQSQPRFFDISSESWTICPELLEDALKKAAAKNSLPKAIIATDLYGQSCDINRIEGLAQNFGVKLIFDSAESLGARYQDRQCGSGGDFAILSFNGNKMITTGGGGMLVSRDRLAIDRARFLSTQARDLAPHYEHSTYGYNYRMSNIAAAIGLGQLSVLDERVRRRRTIFSRYRNALDNVEGIEFMPEPNWSHCSRWLTAITVDPLKSGKTRDCIRLHLLKHGIESRPLWKPMHLQPLFSGSLYVGRGLDERLFANGLCLPSGSDMSDGEQDEVIQEIRDCLNGE